MKTPQRILIVDDDAHTRQLLCDILAPEQYLLSQASDGKEALTLIEKEGTDLVITDRSMPGMGGMALLKEIMQKYPALPSLMLSAYGEEKMWSDAMGSGAHDYLLKPFKPEDILKAVKKIFTV